MIRMLDDYMWDETLRYEAHRLIYTPQDALPLEFGGIMGAAVLGALLVDTDEGDARRIAIDSPEQRNDFFVRYEREVRRDNGGLFSTEVEALSQAYMELTGDEEVLLRICRNDRLFDLAVGLVVEYMQRLVREQVYATIYEAHPWEEPFAQWLYDAAAIETRRRHLLAVDWTDEEEVYTLAQTLQVPDGDGQECRTFFFEGISSEQLMNAYFNWLMEEARKMTSVMPDAKVQFAQMRTYILENETDWNFLQPQIDLLPEEERLLFRKWMNEWTVFVSGKMTSALTGDFPAYRPKPNFKQLFFPDKVLPCPPENNYVEVCNYIMERCRYDEAFNTYYKSRTRVDLCGQLTALFGWVVDPNHLGKRLNSRKNFRK